jgi:hypothetical protein
MIALFKYGYLIAAIFIAGDVVNTLCCKETFKSSFPLRFSVAYALGTGTLGLLIFYLSYGGGTINFKNTFFLSLPFIAYFIYATIKGRARLHSGMASVKPSGGSFRNGIVEYFFIILILASVSIITFRALYLPKHMADDRAQWGIKAKILYHEGTIYADDFFHPERVLYHASYPPLVPLLESLFYGALETMNDRAGKMPFPLFFFSLLLFFYASQRRFATRRHALMCTAMMAVLPIFVTDVHGNPSSGYADIPLTFYYTIAAFSLFSWIKDRQREDILLATVCITFAIFTKREGLVLWGTAILALLLYFLRMHRSRFLKKAFSGAIFALVPLILLIPWFHFQSTLNPGPWEQDFQLPHLTGAYLYPLLHRVPPILLSILNEFLTVRSFSIAGVIFLIAAAASPKASLSFPHAFLILLPLANICALFAAILMYPWPWWRNFLHDMPRLLVVNVPLIMYSMSILLYRGTMLKPFRQVQ